MPSPLWQSQGGRGAGDGKGGGISEARVAGVAAKRRRRRRRERETGGTPIPRRASRGTGVPPVSLSFRWTTAATTSPSFLVAKECNA